MPIKASTVRKHSPRTWSVADAKAHLSEVIERAISDGPQQITRRGRKAVVVVDVDEWKRKTAQKPNLSEFLKASPLRNSGLVIERSDEPPRDLDI
jgi:prevent-host-death family protein